MVGPRFANFSNRSLSLGLRGPGNRSRRSNVHVAAPLFPLLVRSGLPEQESRFRLFGLQAY